MSAEQIQPTDQTHVFEELKAYDWDADTHFQGGLSAILGGATEPVQVANLTFRAQCFYYARKKNIYIDFDAYKAYRQSESKSSAIASSGATTQPLPIPDEMAVPKDQLQSLADTPGSVAVVPLEAAPYPPSFAEIVHLINTGQTIPGIIEYPDTVSPELASKSVLKKRRKPWEAHLPEEAVQGAGSVVHNEDGSVTVIEGTFGDRRDEIIQQEYPDA